MMYITGLKALFENGFLSAILRFRVRKADLIYPNERTYGGYIFSCVALSCYKEGPRLQLRVGSKKNMEPLESIRGYLHLICGHAERA